MTKFSGETVPNFEGLVAGAKAWRFSHEGTNLTDRMGLAGVNMVFPEFSPVGSDIQQLITYAHCIDHIIDNGADFRRTAAGKTNRELLEVARIGFEDRYSQGAWSSAAHVSTAGFLSQAATVEATARSESIDENRYRELINAIWVRMIVSFGKQLVSPESKLDPVGKIGAGYPFDDLFELYKGYCSGNEIDSVLDGQRSHQLYMWTMAVQEQFDNHARASNANGNVPSLQDRTTLYSERAANAGIRPSILIGTSLAVKSLISIKSGLIRVLPRYANERALNQN